MDRLEAVGVNAPQIEYWNGPVGERWAGLADTQDIILAALGSTAMDACDIQVGHAVLDVGCGSGTTTIEITRRVGARGRVLGIDISTPMLDIGRARLEALNTDSVTLVNSDVATYRFEAQTFDRVYSRFGVMFFVEPIVAFTNIRSSMKSGGRLAFVCWQSAAKNTYMGMPLEIALRHVPTPPPADADAPGPLAFANPDRVRHILSRAGFVDINLEPLETLVPLGADVPETVGKLIEMGPVSRLLNNASEDIKARVEIDLGEALAEFQTVNGVMINSATWIVSATSP